MAKTTRIEVDSFMIVTGVAYDVYKKKLINKKERPQLKKALNDLIKLCAWLKATTDRNQALILDKSLAKKHGAEARRVMKKLKI